MALVLDAGQEIADAVSLADAKLQLGVGHVHHDAMIGRMLKAAVAYLQNRTGRQFCSATYTLYLDEFPCGLIELRLAPLVSVDAVRYVDLAGVQQTLDAAAYQADLHSQPGRLLPALGTSWPFARRQLNAVEVAITAGGAPADVPELAQQAVLMLVALWYENRGDVPVGTVPKPMEAAIGGMIADLKWTM